MQKLIYKYLFNKLSAREKAEIVKWLNEDLVNVRLFKNFIGYWNLTKLDVDLSRQKMWRKLPLSEESSRKTRPVQRIRPVWSAAWKVAAMLILIAGLSLIYIQWEGTQSTDLISGPGKELIRNTKPGQKLTFMLPDGSTVKLNSGSTLVYDEVFAGEERIVSLKGEAFFDIVRNPSKPFKINLEGNQVIVLGTSFNVNAYPENRSTIVSVRSGVVSFNNRKGTGETVLVENERAVYDRSSKTVEKQSISEDEIDFDWVENYLAFEGDDLQSALKVISRWYGVEFVMDKNLASDKKYTAKFKNPSLNEVMKTLAFAYDFKFSQQGNKIYIE